MTDGETADPRSDTFDPFTAPRSSVRRDYLRKLEAVAFAALPFREDRTGQMIHPQSPAMINLRAAINELEG